MGKKKSKKSKKQKKEEIIDDESDDGEVIDIDAGEEEDQIEDGDDDDDDYYDRKPEESEGEDYEEKGDTKGEEATGAKKSLFKVPAITFTQAEMPLLGYAMASFVFFLAAVGKQCKSNFRRRTEEFAAGFLEDFFDEITDNIETFDDDFGVNPYIGLYGGMSGFSCLPTGYYAYAVCLGIFGILISVGLVVWMKYNDSLAAKRNAAEGDIEMDGESISNEDVKSVSELFLDNHKWLFNGFLFLWAVIGWAIFTFGARGVFAMTGNGFFALWAMLLFSIWNMGVTADTITTQAKKSEPWIHVVTFGSIVTIIELTARYTWRFHPNKGIASYGLSVAVISIVFGLVIAAFSMIGNEERKLDPKIRLWTLALLVVLWLLTACLTTFIGPFTITGNGYFVVWGCTIASALAFANIQSEIQ